MTESEALSTLQEQLASRDGFLARLRRGEGLDYGAVEQVRAALDALTALWADRAYVPKYALMPLVDLYSPIAECKQLYPDLAPDLDRLAFELVRRTENVFYAQPAGMTEEEAVALVYGHLRGLSGIAFTFHHREPLSDLEWATDLLT